ncbi:MAG: hypothetical protein ISS23_01595 [Nanoarchaeota archaeon]|nr:hypothetical protein [Nanoarchaeota archaeon]
MGRMLNNTIIVCCIGLLSLTGYSIKKDLDYKRENTFTARGIVKSDSLNHHQHGGYKVFTIDGQAIKYNGPNKSVQDILETFEVRIEPGMEIEFTGYPHKNIEDFIYAQKIKILKEKNIFKN